MGRLDGKVALITGGASGFGATASQFFAREGAKVMITDKNDKGAAKVAKGIGDAATSMAHDVTREAEWKAVVDATVETFGGVHVLMNNAGVFGSGAPQSIEDISLEEWRFVNDINMDGVFLGCRAVIGAMAKSGGGSIVNISSIAGIRATPDIVAYGASKGAVRQLTKSVAVYCGRKGYKIRCNSIHPGMVRTPLGDDVLKHSWGDADKGAEERLKGIPLGELGTVEDIANAALYFASDESRYVTGAELVIDGGVLYSR